MRRLRASFVRFFGLFRRRRHEAEMNAELQEHLEGLAKRYVAKGMSPEDAGYAARRELGGVEQIKESARDQRRSSWVEHLLQDLAYAARSLRKAPAFAIAAILTLALGIGVNSALFTVYNAVALRSLPVRQPDELFKIRDGYDQLKVHRGWFSWPDYIDLRDRNATLTGLAACRPLFPRLDAANSGSAVPTDYGPIPGLVEVQLVSDNYFAVLGAGVGLGRAFSAEENRSPGGAPVIVLSHSFWKNHFHADPAVIGTSISLNGNPFTVIGVTADDFVGHRPAPPVGWVPLVLRDRLQRVSPSWLMDRADNFFELVGRARVGVSMSQVKTDLDHIAASLATDYPDETRKLSLRLEAGMKFVDLPLEGERLAAVSPVILAFVMVLAIACTNVANLLLARGLTRRQEIGIRLALGAGRGRIPDSC